MPGQLLAEQPKRICVRFLTFLRKSEKALERQSAAGLKLGPIFRQIVQRLEQQNLEHQSDVVLLALGIALGAAEKIKYPEIADTL